MNKKQLRSIVKKYLNNQASFEERQILDNWYFEEFKKNESTDTDGSFLFFKDEIWENTLRKAGLLRSKRSSFYWVSRIAAILIIAVSSVSMYKYFRTDSHVQKMRVAENVNTIVPGKNQAVLTLPDGKIINLSSTQDGLVISGDKVAYNNGEVVADTNSISENAHLNYPIAMLTTPRGGQYNITLNDGTKVWLNAASSLKYPIKFSGHTRIVTLEGEGYFEVAKDKTHPFIVMSKGQQVQDLGTHFNINAYADESSVKTTLLEGSVKVTTLYAAGKSDQKILSPGEQSILSTQGNLVVKQVNVNDEIAWQKGYFVFNYSDLQSVMRQISRWYNVNVVYKGKIPATAYSGKIPRGVGAKELIGMLNYLGIKCTIQNNNIVVNP